MSKFANNIDILRKPVGINDVFGLYIAVTDYLGRRLNFIHPLLTRKNPKHTEMRLLILNSMLLFILQSPAAITVEEILRGNEEAMGGADAISAVESVLTVSELSAAGFAGTDTVASMKPDKFAEDIDLGILRQISITDGINYWASDHAGQAREAAGRERDLLRITAYFANFRYLYPDAEMAQFSGEEDGHYIVTFRVVEDVPVSVYFDKNTFLIARSEVDTDFGRSVTEYSDYWEVKGIMLPHTLVQTTGPQRITSRITEVYINEGVTEEQFRPPGYESDGFEIGEGCIDIPIEVVGNLVFVDVSVSDSPPLRFLLDTGAGMTVVDRGALDVGGDVEIPAMGVGGTENATLHKAEYLAIGGAKLFNPTVAALDLSGIGDKVGVGLDGILGYDFISKFIIKIDYENRVLSIYDPVSFDYPNEVSFIPVEFVSNIPLIEMACDDYRGKFVLDMGNCVSVILHGPFVAENGLLAKYPATRATALGGIGGVTAVYPACFGQLELGDFKITEPVVYLSAAEDDGFAMTSAIGNVGGEVLSRFTVYLDYPNSRIGLIPNAKFDEPFPESDEK